jgi:hypothetical protein
MKPSHGVVAAALLAALVGPSVVLGVDERPDSTQTIPVDCTMIEKSAAIIRERVGEDFFAKHLQFGAMYLRDFRGIEVASSWRRDASATDYSARPEVYYHVDWDIRFGDSRRAWVSFDIDTAGRLLSDPSTLSLPPCAEDPGACIFAITREDARRIGVEINGVTGFSDSLEFRWSPRLHRYVWVVQLWRPGTNPYSGIAPPEGARFALIDANTGEVIEAGPWTLPSQVRE